MGRYSSHVRENAQPIAREVHPIWRGIGCLIILIVPFLSYGVTAITLPMFKSRGLVPRDLIVTSRLPDWMWSINPGLTSWLQGIVGSPDFLPTVILLLIYIMIIGSLFSVIYSMIYRMARPRRYGPMDAPPIRVKTKKYKR